MPRFEITSPDGKKFEITAPEGATQEQALAYAQQQFSGGNAKARKPDALDDPNMAVAGMSDAEKFITGIGMGAANVGRGMIQLVGGDNQQRIDEAKTRDAPLAATGAGTAGEITGNLMLTAIPGAATQSALTKGAAMVLPRVLTGTAGAAGAGALVTAATDPVATGESSAGKIGMGALGGAVGDAAVRGASRLIQPIRQSPAVARLLGEGVVPTPGQSAGADSFLGRTEQKLQSVLGVGDVIKHGRDRAATEFNKAALNRSMPGGKVSEAGNAGLDQVKDALDDAYSRVFSGKTVQPDRALATAINAAKQAPVLPLNESSEKTFDSVMKKVVWDRIPQANMGPGSVMTMPADKMKQEIIGDLGKVARQHLDSPIAAEKALGEALMEARNAAQSWLKGEVAKTSPRAAMEIDMIDRAFANRMNVGKAVERAKANGGTFTPNQLQMSTKPGQALRELANDAQETMGSRVANSGTVDRGMLATLMGGGLAGANSYFGGPGYLTALAAAPMLYSRTGSRYAVGNLPGQKSLAEMLRAAGPMASQTGRAYLEDQ